MKKGSDYLKKKNSPEKQVKDPVYYDTIGLVIIILLGIIIYPNSFPCSFHFDDFPCIVNNKQIRHLWDLKTWWDYRQTRLVAYYSFALNYHFNQLNVWGYHFVNLVIHLINSCLVWWLTVLIFSSPALKDHSISQQKKVLAFMTALLFVSHPLATQSVTYIYQRLASMVAMFYLLSLALYMKARFLNKGKTAKYVLFAGSLISAGLAMLTKQNAFTLPFAILLFELFFLRTKKLSINFKDYRVLFLMAAFLCILIIIPLNTSFNVFKPIPPHEGVTYTLTPVNYLFTQFKVIVKYIQLLFLPVNLTVEYDFPVSDNFFGIRTLLSFLFLLSLIILAIFLYKKQRVISFGIFWFFLTLSVESGVIPIKDVIFEHRTYLPSFGFFLILSTVIYGLSGNRYKVPASVIMVIIVIMNSYLTYERNKVWKDELSLWSDNIEKTPNNVRLITNRGVAYGELGQVDKAMADFSRAIAINPGYGIAYYQRGVAYAELRQWEKSVADNSKAIELIHNYLLAHLNRGVAYGNLGQWDKAIADFTDVIRINPDYKKAYENRSVAYSKSGQWNEAIADYSKMIGLGPDNANTYYNRGFAYASAGQWEKAMADYSSALRIDPNFTIAYSNREIARHRLANDKK